MQEKAPPTGGFKITEFCTTHKVPKLKKIWGQSLSGPSQRVEAVKKANRMLGYIARSIEYKSKDVLLALYNTLVRPQRSTVCISGDGSVRKILRHWKRFRVQAN